MVSKDEFEKTLKNCGFTNTSDLDKKFDGLIKAISKENISDKRELAMFLANVYHESGGLQHKREREPKEAGFYDGGKNYIGRGYIQLTHKYNYADASKDLFNDHRLVQKPELVEESESLSWKTAVWFWMKKVHPKLKNDSDDFDRTIKIINPVDTQEQTRSRRTNHSIIRSALKLPGESHHRSYYEGKEEEEETDNNSSCSIL